MVSTMANFLVWVLPDVNNQFSKTVFMQFLCNYTCERPNTLKKHVNPKHTVHKCSLCSEEFTTSMDLLSHIAIQHHDEEEANGLNAQSTPKSEKEKQI